MTTPHNSLAGKVLRGLTGGAVNSAGTTNPSTMYHDVSSAGDGASVSSLAAAARPRVPTFYPQATEVIPCEGSSYWVDMPSSEFPRRVIWQALFGKKKCLPVNKMLTDNCPYAEADESWKDDPAPVTLGAGFFMFFRDLIEVERSLA